MKEEVEAAVPEIQAVAAVREWLVMTTTTMTIGVAVALEIAAARETEAVPTTAEAEMAAATREAVLQEPVAAVQEAAGLHPAVLYPGVQVAATEEDHHLNPRLRKKAAIKRLLQEVNKLN